MDADRFDRLSVALAGPRSRRTLLAGAAAAVLTLAGLGADVDVKAKKAKRCLRNGAACQPSKAKRCCSGICAPQGNGHVCAPAPGAFGCTNEISDDSCAGNFQNCPNHGGFCIVNENHQPLCIANQVCAVCATDADCASIFPNGGRCIKRCDRCQNQTGGTICVLFMS